MSAPIAVEAESGAVLLPADQTQRYRNITPWHTHIACDADLRTRALPYRDLAKRIIITYPDGEHHDR